MTQNRLLNVVLTALVIVSVIMGAIAVPMVALSSAAQPASPSENGTTPTNVDSNADTTTNSPITGVINTNTNTNANELSNTNTNNNRANASADAHSTGISLDLGNENGNGANGCTLPAPGTDSFEELQKLLSDNASEGDNFGQSVAIDRANETLVVGAPGDDNENGNDAGAVYVFTCQGSQFVETQTLLASDGQLGDFFGTSVAIDRANETIVVGAPDAANESGERTGAAYVFERQGGSFVETQKLTASDGSESDQFGRSVAIDGWIVGGAPFDDNANRTDAGAAYVFD